MTTIEFSTSSFQNRLKKLEWPNEHEKSLPFALMFTILTVMVVASVVAQVEAFSMDYGAITPSKPVMQDINGSNLKDIIVDQQAVISTTLANNYGEEMSFVALLEVRNKDGVTEYLSWQNGIIPTNSNVDIGISWMPVATGRYEARTFVISSFVNPQILSPIASSELVVSTFTSELISSSNLDSLPQETKGGITRLIEDYYKANIEPFEGFEYGSVRYDMEITAGLHSGPPYELTSRANATIKGTDAFESFTLRARYNIDDKLSDIILRHHNKYLPEQIKEIAVEKAKQDNDVKKFFIENGNNSTESSTVIVVQTEYLNSREVNETKYTKTYGEEIVIRPEFSFLPDSSHVIEIGFSTWPRDAFENQQDIIGVESPFITVYLEPITYKVLGTYEFPTSQDMD